MYIAILKINITREILVANSLQKSEVNKKRRVKGGGGGEEGILTEVYRIRYIYIHTHERINNFVMYRSNHSYR